MKETLLPVVRSCAGRTVPIGAYAVDEQGRARFVPVLDVQRLARYAVAGAAVGATATVAVAWSRRGRGPSIGSVRMGPGGWVSLKNARPSALRADRSARPWWARLLRAHRVVAE
ncbi:hypothetical protein [Dactylosporangium sp. NPDC049140]|uniref:hypothetical protein n=1 Tax=Dactylosporangium sp. NPDC049140 TaxID=3155647 RepID=UPI0033EF975B